jgi:hypothetical protein
MGFSTKRMEGNFEDAFSLEVNTVLKRFSKDMMLQLLYFSPVSQGHLSSHGMALGFSRLGYPVPGVSHIQNSFYNLHSIN